ncbi:CopG family ribbon-helix-helix protein [Natronolimnobius sp. AArcel1]|uniref:CopG family ribbon-helix-helix protein n=1 Tax=Natronolimnobius sp. AArcel1 TaxID=1679093 RepID=UPI0013EC53C7|nr:CopG family ribbon-helix-helix protein [Natronolimnobius sp. AArcel1]NGM68357.1 CopG family ribbon-helix-helix protein [Natronolimnobius sp. AArcel1]
MPVVSVSMPAELIERLDAVADDHDYTGRSEVVRKSARALLSEFDDERLENRPLAGTVTVLYEFANQSVERRVTDIRHDHETAIVTNDHSHVGTGDIRTGSTDTAPADDAADPVAKATINRTQPSYCLDLFVLESDLEEISQFVGQLRAVDGVETVDYSLVPLDSVGQLPETQQNT